MNTDLVCKHAFFSLILFFLIINVANSQQQSNVLLYELDSYASDKYGTSDFLLNGWKYYPEYFTASGNPYFEDADWKAGSVNSVDETFEVEALRYNIQMDELVLMRTLMDGSTVFVMLNKDFVQAFTLGTHSFVNTTHLDFDVNLSGYVELIYAGDFKFLAKHEKMFVKNYSANTPNGSISGQHSNNYILMDGQLQKVPSKKILLNLFPDHKKKIKVFMKTNKINFKKANNDQLQKLMQFCDEL